MTSRTILFASSLALLLAACGDDATGSGGSGASTGEGGSGGSIGDGGSTPASTSTGTTTTGGDGGSGGAGGDGAGGDGVGGAGGAGGDGSGGAPSCDEEGFVAAAEDAGEIQGQFFYIAQTSIEGGADVLQFEIFSTIGAPGVRDVLDQNYDSCDPCVILRQGCNEDLEECEKTFLANSGTLTIDDFDGTFSGTLDGAELIEVTLEGIVSTPVEGGATWCLDGYGFEAPIQE